jgi:hypothetical protein
MHVEAQSNADYSRLGCLRHAPLSALAGYSAIVHLATLEPVRVFTQPAASALAIAQFVRVQVANISPLRTNIQRHRTNCHPPATAAS